MWFCVCVRCDACLSSSWGVGLGDTPVSCTVLERFPGVRCRRSRAWYIRGGFVAFLPLRIVTMVALVSLLLCFVRLCQFSVRGLLLVFVVCFISFGVF